MSHDRSFTVCGQPLPVLRSPADGASIGANQAFQLTWTGEEGLKYHLQVDDQDTFTSPIIDVDQFAWPTYSVPRAYLTPGTYHWRVRHLLGEPCSGYGPCTAVRHFTITAAGQTQGFLPMLIGPAP